MPKRPSSDAGFARVAAAVAKAADGCVAPDDDLSSVVALTEFIEFLQAQLDEVSVRRDELLAPLLSEGSNRQLAKKLGMSRQRVDQLARFGRMGRPVRKRRTT